MLARCLSIHAGYACAHSGACCSAGWPIPVEPALVEAVSRRLIPLAARASAPFATGPGGALVLAANAGGDCVFFERDGGRLCAVHRTSGADLLPVACRNFPRVALRDPGGLSVTLSHYCPTAAGLLFQDADIAIVLAPPSLTLEGQVDAFDATGVLPPLLREGMLSDLEGCRAWERLTVAVMNDRSVSAHDAVRVVARATADACTWCPGGESLEERMEAAFAAARAAGGGKHYRADYLEHGVKSFLAAHAFASRLAYGPGGLGAVAGAMASILALVERNLAHARSQRDPDREAFIAAVRAADFQLRHTADDDGAGSVSSLRRD